MKIRSISRSRRGTFIPFLAVTVTALFAFLALAIDLGMLTVGRTNSQNAADTAALIGARILSNKVGVTQNDKTNAIAVVKDIVPQNNFMNSGFTAPPDADIQVGLYDYNGTTFAPDFTNSTLPSGKSWTACRVTVTATQPTFFAKVLGITSLPNGATATAVHRPRDVAMILDMTGSMKFGSIGGWTTGFSGDYSGNVLGMMNPDPNHPQFGHYVRYLTYDENVTPTPTLAASTTVASRPNPMWMIQKYLFETTGDVVAPNNWTVETPGGPPVVFDFRFDPSNRKSPATKVAAGSASTGALWNAFHRWFTTTPTDTPNTALDAIDQTNVYKYSSFQPAIASTVDKTTYQQRTFTWTGYNPFDLDSTSGPVPAPDSFAKQEPTGTGPSAIPYAGDVFPRKKGVNPATGTSWDPTTTTGAAVNAAQLLGWDSLPNRGSFPTGTGRWGYQPAGSVSGVTLAYASSWANFRDATWERYGYDLDINDYVTNRATNSNGSTPDWDPRWDWRLNTGTASTTVVGWQMGGSGNSWQHVRKTISGDTTPNPPGTVRRTNPPDSTASTGTGATNAQSITFRPRLKTPGSNRISSFNGYSMGPGYWGKTFFMWPPDPRFGVQDPQSGATTKWPDVTQPDWDNTSTTTMQQSDPAFAKDGSNALVPMCDWRRRFFYKGNGSETTTSSWFDPTADNDPTVSGTQSIDQCLFGTSAGHVLQDADNGGSARFKINYRAVLAWLKSGPQVLPTNLRAGRIVYYTSIPNDCDSPDSDADKRFWRDYIDFVIGYDRNISSYDPSRSLAGVETNAWPEGSSISIGATTSYFPYTTSSSTPNWSLLAPITPTNSGSVTGATNPTGGTPVGSDPQPYSNYTTNPNRPRAHFWFGPISMLDFLSSRSPRKYWWPGTCHEAQSWQLKAAVNSALEDIRVNHPNDYCGLAYFATNFDTPRVPLGQKWTDLKNALFYPGPDGSGNTTNLLPDISASPPNTTKEVYPFNPDDISGTFTGNWLTGILPNANGGTDPNTGFALGYNMLSSSSTLKSSTTPNGQNGGTGRMGATKLVVFETDGVPNGNPSWTTTGSGSDTRYQNSGTNVTWSSSLYTDTNDTIRYPRRNLDVSTLNTAAKIALASIHQINLPVSTSTKGGFSLPNSEARVYPIGFGDLFTGYDGTAAWTTNTANPAAARNAITFLLRGAQIGGTQPVSATAMPSEYVITGSYRTRITNLRTALERIMQSGVQVTLIE